MKLFLTTTRLGRAFTPRFHQLVHPGVPYWGFAQYGCWFCRWMWKGFAPSLDRFEDESRHEYAPVEDGKLGVSMTSVAKRQLEELDPETAKKIEEAIERIRSEYRGE